MLRKIICVAMLLILVTSCGDTFGSIKRGLTGAKANTSDEFLVKKKDPLILPPDFENLPLPDQENTSEEEFSILEENLETFIENESSTPSSVEDSIIKKIQTK